MMNSRQNVTQNKVTETAGLSAGYNLAYNYDSTKKHQLKNIAEVEYRDKVTPKPATPSNKKKDNKYTYDANGNQIYVNTVQEKLDGSQDNKALEKTMLWDEENRLGAISINGYVSSYTYDASGERVSKLSGGGQGIFVNSAFSGGKTATSDFTLYTSPYLVAQSGGRYTKHIYIGSQRIVSKLGDFDSYGADPRRIEKAGDSFNGVKVDYASKYKSALNVVKANYESLKVPYYGLDNDDYVNGLGFCCNPNPTTASTSPTGKSAASKNDNAELQQYYYHPDHLGSSSYISNLDGEVVQHVEYVPFGEVFLEEKNSNWNTPYLFNGKELDKETGMSYYGARYYEPKTSVWICVDPLVEKTMSPYGYCHNNPVNLVDPDGRYAVSVHYRITVNAMIKMGYSKEVARRIAHGARMYADHPDKKALFLNNLGKSGSLHYRDDMDYSKTAGSQDEKNSRWHSMMSNEEKKNGMTHYEAMQRGLQFGWSNIFAQEEGLDESKIYQGLHALQDAYAHNGASTDEHLKLPTISAIGMLINDMYGDTSKAELITETAAVVLSLFNKKNNAANLKNGMKLDFNGMSNKQLEKVTNLLYENGFVLEKTKKLDNTYVLKQNF